MLSDTAEALSLNGFTQVGLWTDVVPVPWFVWRLIPVNIEAPPAPSRPIPEPSKRLPEPPRSDSLPSYDGGIIPGSFPTASW